ncbi:putative Short-chain dehydrogenase/reductase (SDR) (plasmid) [Cupriavidus taiwanensis]|uniref:Putative Short-chain dehydrogenase/reductase (SDR) n=1 Tax=Cupriavidus taiwanensis TaxID=164546 RepID=A0A375IIK6_9BURK|nr:SDR family oxidoreductase [Cupriavidus taiwanensis]SOY65142.1 putative Short-chain dehydrogenase/reductase (SDR) [Cupriavidus taiwanensis]SOY65362.1 putative Short-chain dehydrogenase/reductase (SDR) [Cupriavidus taiwanensis]SOY94195.1 putative Short-chain dehydrogenase/reductase (SDR) [Cupriavidus taiwanensis]SOZ69802.1 putative Short-chain dehydrogenase/reductase (SDR) [Cupriavidus taiwanensis]SOZ85837.1 putative Short-chain dehydrogenase/reductase (SDR) [Cupriavidus taiwanensis]
MSASSLSGKVAVILGGSGGIGLAAGATLAHLGASIVLAGRDADKTASAAAALPAGNHLAAVAEIGDSASLRQLADTASHHYGRVDILVNSAGFTRPIPHADLDALDDGLIDALFAINWRGQFAAIRAFAPLLRAHGDGLVVNVGSIAGRTGQGSNVAYCAAKAGLDVMAMSLGRALAPAIRVLNVSPGVVDTGFVPGRDDSFNERAARTTPLRRIGQAQDVADAIAACATSLRFATGTTIVVDGGRQLG